MDETKSLFNSLSGTQKSEKDKELEERCGNMLKPRKTFRDAVHGDVMINKLELAVIDTEDFQRLGKMRQLGPTHLVYRCATHTRRGCQNQRRR